VVLYDFFDSVEYHNYDILFHLPPSVTPEIKRDHILSLSSGDDSVFIVPAISSDLKDVVLSEGFMSVKGAAVKAKVATLLTEGKGRVHSVLFLLPGEELRNLKRIFKEESDEGIAVRITFKKGKSRVVLFKSVSSVSLNLMGYTTTREFEIF
jgi:hypothetical protein